MGKLLKIPDLVKILRGKNSSSIVLTSGVFDLFHCGHLNYLKKCRAYGDILIVHILGNKCIKLAKGKNRPIIDEQKRAELIASLEFIDFVFISNRFTYSKVILTKIRPNILVKVIAKKYTPNVRREFTKRLKKQYNVRTVFLKRIKNISTSKIISRIKSI